jgi:hypothetical protein
MQGLAGGELFAVRKSKGPPFLHVRSLFLDLTVKGTPASQCPRERNSSTFATIRFSLMLLPAVVSWKGCTVANGQRRGQSRFPRLHESDAGA